MLSLFDLVNKKWVSWYLVYIETTAPRFWKPFLKKGFYHVQLWRSQRFGPDVNDVMWLVVDPGMECADAYLVMDSSPPWERNELKCFVQRVEISAPIARVRDWFHVGPVTCVELAKAFLGIRAFFVRTPYQLYKYVRSRGYKLKR